MNSTFNLKKKLPIIIFVVVSLYAAVFATFMVVAGILPSRIYNNERYLARTDATANKVQYKRTVQDDGVVTVTCGRMTGTDVVWEYKSDGDMTLQMHYTFQVTSGKAKLILVNPDKTVTTLVELDSAAAADSQIKHPDTSDNTAAQETESTMDLELKQGDSQIKIVCGKGTSFSLRFYLNGL